MGKGRKIRRRSRRKRGSSHTAGEAAPKAAPSYLSNHIVGSDRRSENDVRPRHDVEGVLKNSNFVAGIVINKK